MRIFLGLTLLLPFFTWLCAVTTDAFIKDPMAVLIATVCGLITAVGFAGLYLLCTGDK